MQLMAGNIDGKATLHNRTRNQTSKSSQKEGCSRGMDPNLGNNTVVTLIERNKVIFRGL